MLYLADQRAEADNKAAGRTAPVPARPPSERWLRYGYVNAPGAPRGTPQRSLDAAQRRDQGTGATLAVLRQRKLIETRTDELTAAAARKAL